MTPSLSNSIISQLHLSAMTSFAIYFLCLLTLRTSHSLTCIRMFPLRNEGVVGRRFQCRSDECSMDRRAFVSASIGGLGLLVPNYSSSASSSSSSSSPVSSSEAFRSAAYGREEYTNSIIASRDTNISPREVYDTIASDYLKEAYEVALRDGKSGPRALDVGAGAGVSTKVLYEMGYHHIDAIDWSGSAWQRFVVEEGYCPDEVTFYELDDERYLDLWRRNHPSGDGLYDVIVFNFAVNERKATQFASELLSANGRLLAPINTNNDYWLKQTYEVMDRRGKVLWSAADVGAWSVQFQPDVTQDTCSGVWCPPFNGFQKKK